jgi:mediator of RNA polymerase II transcription subunit 6
MSDQLGISWHDSTWIPHLNPANILDYFCQKSNPFYDKSCNNELAKMQRLSSEQMSMMTGIEYTLLHVQEPILYVIRKQDRIGPDTATPLVDFYILAGIVYQAPDLNSIIQSRILNSALNLKTALEEFQAIAIFNPSIGHSWKHQQEAQKFKTTSSKPKGLERASQGPTEYTRFQMKVNSLMKNFNESN